MKRTVPLLITAIVGLVLIVAHFIPWTVSWGEVAAVWFDVLAAIAFILGGGNLLMSHLRKISDNRPGWGYSAITLVAFFVTLVFGLGKLGTQPQPIQEHYGESFAPLALADFPESQVATVPGRIPWRDVEPELPPSVRRQLSEAEGQLRFVGWMSTDQKQDLLGYRDQLDWQCSIEQLAMVAKPPEGAAGLAQYVDHDAIAFAGSMTEETRDTLLALDGANEAWRSAIEKLFAAGQRETSVSMPDAPAGLELSESMQRRLRLDTSGTRLEATLLGPLSPGDRAALADGFPRINPYDEARRDAFVTELKGLGSLNAAQETAVRKVLAGTWTQEQLRTAIDDAGVPKETPKSACEMLDERRRGVDVIEPKKPPVGEPKTLNEAQVAALLAFTGDTRAPEAAGLNEALVAAGPFDRQGAVASFLGSQPTVAEFKESIYFKAIAAGPLSDEQKAFLLDEIREQRAWEAATTELFLASHVAKYPLSGEYAGQGSWFWWIYEYLLKPLTATMFSMLAFYVASAAYRAFRAKNLEAILLLGTAFLILLGRVPAGIWLTSWLPDELSGLRIEELSITVMVVFNTAGNRAIMIGIALGIASTSLKVLLGVDRSYLGGGED